MPSSWSERCTQAEKQELQALLTNLYAIGGVLVRAARALQLAFRALSRNHALVAMCLMLLIAFARLQLVSFVVCAVAQGTAFWRWRKWREEEKRRGWRLYVLHALAHCISVTF